MRKLPGSISRRCHGSTFLFNQPGVGVLGLALSGWPLSREAEMQ
jgi:hypothetical protein